MSVTGEFHRLAADCIAYLAASDAARADPWTLALERAIARSEESLVAAASDALALLEDGPRTPSFGAARERSEFRELSEHLAAICRLIVGRPSHEPSRHDEGS